MELIKYETKVNIKHVPLTGDAEGLTSLRMGGHINLYVTGWGGSFPGSVASGDLKVLATLHPTRMPELKDVPTFNEIGYPKVIMYSWYSYVAPKGTPEEIMEKLEKGFKLAIQDPITQERLKKLRFNEHYLSRTEIANFMKSEYHKWGELVKAMDLTIK